MSSFDFAALARVNTAALNHRCLIRQTPEDFRVEEQLPFEPAGQGPHVMLQITKTDTNTDWLAKQLAQFAGVEEVAIGYAGLKDRHAVTTQWFSVNTEGVTEPDWSAFESDLITINQITRHNKKLKRGVLSGNRFTLNLTVVEGDKQSWESALSQVQKDGVPNYFGEQRFGHQMNNLQAVEQWFQQGRKPKSRTKKSLYLSSARSWLFNLIVSERVKNSNWNQWLKGDVMQLNGSHSCFQSDNDDIQLHDRLARFDIHPTGPLVGQGDLLSQDDCQQLETTILADWQDWLQALSRQGLKQERRAIRLLPSDFNWQWFDTHLQVSFFLPAGCFATSVLRELAIIEDGSERFSQPLSPSQQK